MSGNNTSKNESVNLACRFDKSTYEMLAAEAKKKGISLNSLMNSISKKYLSWDRNANEIGFVPLSKKTVKEIFDSLDVQTITRIAQSVGHTIPRELIFLNYGKITFENIIKVLENSGIPFGTVRHDIIGSKHNMSFHHNISKNFSIYLSELIKEMAIDLSFKVNIHNIDSSLVCMEIKENNNDVS